MKRRISFVGIAIAVLLLTGCGSSLSGNYSKNYEIKSFETMRKFASDTAYNLDFNGNKVKISGFDNNPSATYDYELKGKTVYIKMPNSTYKELYIIDDNTIGNREFSPQIIWKKSWKNRG